MRLAWREVVGVVADVKFNGVTSETPMQVYLPLDAGAGAVSGDRRAHDDGCRRRARRPSSAIVLDLDKDLPLFQVRTMEAMLDDSIARERMSMLVFAVFAVVALTLASIGLYGVVAHGVTERTHEIGVRMALGADARHVLGLVVRQGLSMAIAGTVIGVAGVARAVAVGPGAALRRHRHRSGDVRRGCRDAARRGGRRVLHPGVARDARRSDAGAARRITITVHAG